MVPDNKCLTSEKFKENKHSTKSILCRVCSSHEDERNLRYCNCNLLLLPKNVYLSKETCPMGMTQIQFNLTSDLFNAILGKVEETAENSLIYKILSYPSNRIYCIITCTNVIP